MTVPISGVLYSDGGEPVADLDHNLSSRER